MGPVAADRIRKACGYALAVAITVLMFRVFGRVANGTQSLSDAELWVGVVLVALGVAWVRAAKRIRASRRPP